ncbi:hypothetical protein ASPTUDRAFT_115765 [Aspergillus tubingensis CBS 134.48]|uniref:Uncharacterized protein n=1 Tax=Aspergillus tubingensis (strain CBS 134.48) TaxID=767770 RepID=A0A1L9NBT6_ASPTC|nr:hypothetical protein ASPTUDRAFT_115765 [Aspergillus tubingensis CBS 134.48]
MSLNEIWQAASASPYTPPVSKDSQFFVGFSLLLAAFILTGLFGLNRSFLSIASFGVPASLAFGLYSVVLKPISLQTIMTDTEPIFTAVSSNAHHLYTLLQCIGFASRATVQITPDGIRFSAEEMRVIQGLAFLDKALFTSYTFNPPAAPNQGTTDDNNNDDDDSASDPSTYYPCFVVSLSALLETLKIFGTNDSTNPNAGRASSVQPTHPSGPGAFSAPSLLLDRSCTIRYASEGSPLSITLSETGVKTTCELTTYETEGSEVDIPLQRDAIIMKIIMRSAWLHNAISELAATSPSVLKISASATREPFFALSGTGGSFSESSVEFSKAKLAPTVTETFLVSPPSSMGSRLKQNYKFALIQKAARAMAVANKVSIRGDRQGVLSLQFMIEFDANGAGGVRPLKGGPPPVVTFVDFRFVPLLDDEEGDDLE